MASVDDNDLLEEDPFKGEALFLLGMQHQSLDADPDTASSAAPVPAHNFEFDHSI